MVVGKLYDGKGGGGSDGGGEFNICLREDGGDK